MKSITQDNHQTKCLSAKSMQFFQQYRIAKILHAANANKIKGIPAQVSLHADESTSGHAAVRQGYVLPFHEFLPYELAQVHYTAEFQYHPALY